MKHIVRYLGLGLALVILGLAIGNQGKIALGDDQQPPCTITLAPGQSIQAAIDKAPNGAVICLEPGEWEENLVIEKSITLRAAEIKPEPDVVVKSARECWPVILIENNAVVKIEGIKITGAFGDCYKENSEEVCFGIEIRGHAYAVIQNNTISDNDWDGIGMYGSSQATIQNNTISGNRNGISMSESSQAIIENNIIKDNAECGVVSFSDKPTKGEGNRMSGNGVDLCGNLSARLRIPLVKETTKKELSFPGPYSTLQETIDALAPGSTIKVAAGEYQGGLTIWKPLTLIGVGKEQVTIKGTVSLTDEAQGVTIEGVTITGSPISGLLLGSSSQAAIENNTIRGNGCGIWMLGSSQATITNNTISGNRDQGIEMWGSSQATISDSQISGNGYEGISMVNSSQATISDSTISKNGQDGIRMEDSSQATIRGNKIFENEGYGVALYQRPCYDTDKKFEGKVEGSGNEIHDNGKGDVCPEELQFLMTSEGGCYGPKC